MANRKPYRTRGRKGSFVAIPFATRLPLSTLDDGTVLKGDVLGADLGEDLYVVSIDAYVAQRDATSGQGPILVGFAHDDLSVAEINEALEAEVTDPDDIIAKERARRPVRKTGLFPVINVGEVLNDGKAIRTKCGWSEGSGAHRIALWARNQSGATLTTGAIIEWFGTVYGRWQR